MLSPKYKAEQLVIKQLLNYLRKNPEKNLGNIVSLVRKFDNKGLYKEQYDVIEGFIKEENNNWVKLMSKIATEVNPHIVETVFTNFLLNAAIRGCEEIDKNIEKYGYSIPFTILVDPTTACNKKCIGC